MTSQQLDEKSIFQVACSIESTQVRQIYLQHVCGSQPELLQRVSRLLQLQAESPLFLEAPACSMTATVQQPVPTVTASDTSGQWIGPYRLLEQIGEGGMGVVFMAEQREPVRRTVALKVIKPGMDTREVVARFEAERQALALMNHPHIAKVLDGGATLTGRPYFVMELVKGLPINKFCDQHKLGIRQRLELLMSVCRAVQHAHQKGVIHRDLKPSNVLVELHDVTPVPKVIDFGVAKAINQQLTERTLHTGFAQTIGTPLYMSPEQAGQSSLDVDTRSDVYALGVLLYELLTGSTPFENETLKKVGFDEMRRMIREVDPPSPSARISTLHAAALSTISQQRQLDPPQLRRHLRGELDWIVMKAIERDRGRRYETANGLAMDLQRYLRDEPVVACPPSAAYRMRKFARRHKRLLMGVSILGISLLAGTMVASWQAIEAIQARNAARQHLQLADDNFWRAIDAVDQMLMRVGEEKLRDLPHLEGLRRELMVDALRFYEDLQPQHTEDPKVRLRVALAHRQIGFIQLLLGNYRPAEIATHAAHEVLANLYGEYPDDLPFAVELAETYNALGWHTALGQPAKQAQYHQQAISLLEPLVARQPAEATHGGQRLRSRLANSYRSLGARHADLGKHADAEQAFRRAIELGEEDDDSGRAIATLARLHLAVSLESEGRLSEALPETVPAIEYREEHLRAFPTDMFALSELADAYETRARILTQCQHLADADAAFTRAIELRTSLVSSFPAISVHRDRLHRLTSAVISCYQQQGQEERAREVLAGFSPLTIDDLLMRAREHVVLGQRQEALADYDRAATLAPEDFRVFYERGHFYRLPPVDDMKALADFEQAVALAPNDFHSLRALFHHRMYNVRRDRDKCLELAKRMTEVRPAEALGWEFLGRWYLEHDMLDDAEQAFARALEIEPQRAFILAAQGEILRVRGRTDEAMRQYELAMQANPRVTEPWVFRGTEYLRRGKYVEAEHDLRRAIESSDGGAGSWWLRKRLAEACFSQGKYAEALAELTTALDQRPDDLSTLLWISPDRLAACPDEDFRRAMVQLADKASALPNRSPNVYAARCRMHLAQNDLARALADLDRARQEGASPLAVAEALAELGRFRLRRLEYAEAELVLRECVQLRREHSPDDWRYFDALSALGGALQGLQQRAEAESALLAAYQGLHQRAAQIPTGAGDRLPEARERVVQFYEATGQPDKAQQWRTRD